MTLTCTTLGWASGCAQPGRPPVAERSLVPGAQADGYVVRPGDTLYSIAWRFGLDHVALARANGIPAPYTIYVGERVRLDVGKGSTPKAKPAVPPKRVAPSSPPVDAGGNGSSAWGPPTRARVRRGFGNGNKGIDYELRPGDMVAAAATGEVVYAGSGLGGFRHLVIVKHNSTYLSAYSVDRPLRVREGERVSAGTLLVDGDAGGVLHFEIRRNGEPVNPAGLIGG